VYVRSEPPARLRIPRRSFQDGIGKAYAWLPGWCHDGEPRATTRAPSLQRVAPRCPPVRLRRVHKHISAGQRKGVDGLSFTHEFARILHATVGQPLRQTSAQCVRLASTTNKKKNHKHHHNQTNQKHTTPTPPPKHPPPKPHHPPHPPNPHSVHCKAELISARWRLACRDLYRLARRTCSTRV